MSEHPLALHHAAADRLAADQPLGASPHPRGEPVSTSPGAASQSNHFAPEHQARFLEALALWGNARAACKASSVSHQTVYRHRRNSRDFALAWDAALVVAKPQVEDVLGDRALHGIEEVIYYHGEEIGRRHRFDSRLLLAHLARLDAIDCREEVAEVAEDFDAALERLRQGKPVDPLSAEDDEVDLDDPAWLDESLPFAERVLLYMASLDEDGAGEGAEEEAEEEDGPDPFAPADEDDDDYEYEAEEDFDPSLYMLRENSLQDGVTPVTLQQDAVDGEGDREGDGEGEGEPSSRPAAAGAACVATREPEPRPEPAPAPRIWGPWRPIHDGRMQRMT